MSTLPSLASAVLFGHAAGAVALAWLYFRRYRIARPPIGVFGLGDVALIVAGIVLVPILYLALPRAAVAALLALGVLSVLSFAAEPVLRPRWTAWLAVLLLALVDFGAALHFGATSAPFFGVNNVVVVLAVAGVANLWAQTGMKARDLAALAAALTIYDVVATWCLPLMGDLFGHLAGLPFAPLAAWPIGGANSGQWLAIGFGDLLLAAAFPPVARKAFGRPAGLTALVLALVALAAIFAVPPRDAFPVMVVLGPLTVLQYAYWARRRGRERTTWQYAQAEPARAGFADVARASMPRREEAYAPLARLTSEQQATAAV